MSFPESIIISRTCGKLSFVCTYVCGQVGTYTNAPDPSLFFLSLSSSSPSSSCCRLSVVLIEYVKCSPAPPFTTTSFPSFSAGLSSSSSNTIARGKYITRRRGGRGDFFWKKEGEESPPPTGKEGEKEEEARQRPTGKKKQFQFQFWPPSFRPTWKMWPGG